MEYRLWLLRYSSYEWLSGLKQWARRDEQAAHALHMSTAAAMERGGCRIHAPRLSASRPAPQQLKRAQRRRPGCSLPVAASDAGQNASQIALHARNDSALAFQHQLKRRRVAEHAVGRQAEKPLHVTNRAARRSLDNKHAAAVAAAASNNHSDRMWRENGACSVGGGGRLLHRTIAILKSPRERQIERERGKGEQPKRGGSIQCQS